MNERAVWGVGVLALTGWLAIEKSASHSSLQRGTAGPDVEQHAPVSGSSAGTRADADRSTRKGSGTGVRSMTALRASDPLQRMAEFLKILSACDRSQVGEVVAAFERLKAEGLVLPAEEELLNFRLGQLRGADLLTSQTNPPEDPGHIAALKKQFEGWAQTDPKAAAKWLDGIPAGRYHDNMAISWLSSCTSTDPAGSLQLASSLHPTQRAIAARAVAERLTETNSAEESSALLANMERSAGGNHSEYLQTLFDSLSYTIGGSDEKLAASMVDEHLDQGHVSPLSLSRVAAGMGKSDPVGALEWAAGIQDRKKDLPTGEMLTAAVGGMTLEGLDRAEEWTAAHHDAPGIDRMWQALQKQRKVLKEDLSENPDEYHRGD